MRENIKTISLIFIGLIICIIIYNYTKTPKESYDNSKKHLLFIHVPKTGGTALINTNFFKDYVDTLSHHDSLKKEYPYKNKYNYVFTSVRNPYSRLVSAYFYLTKGGMGNSLDLGYQKILEPYNTFESFVKHLKEKPELIYNIIHLEPQINFIFDDNLGLLVDDILYTESLAEDYFVLCEKYSGNCSELIGKNTSKHDDYTKYYTPELQDIVYNIYKDDFQKLGYSYKLSKDKLKNPNYAILFTMYNTPERQQMYEDVLNYYVNILKFPKKNIFIVDSSGNGVDTKYVFKQNQAVFNQNNLEDFNIYFDDSTWLEIQSLLFADKTLKKLKNFDYIIKLTCKYKLPDIQKIVIPDNIELVVQNARKNNHTEIIGFKSNLFSILLDKFYRLDNKYNMEQKLGKIKQGRNIGNLPVLHNVAKYKRADGLILDYL